MSAPAEHPHVPTPVAEVVAEVVADVIDLGTERRARRSSPAGAGWTCAECALAAGPYEPDEAVWLAAVHDQVMHRSRPTATAELAEEPGPDPRPSTVAAG